MHSKVGIPNNVMFAINEMFLCEGFKEEFICFHTHYNDLRDCRFFMYSDIQGVKMPELIKTSYKGDYAIIEMGCAERYYAIDAEICRNMRMTGQANYNIDACIELDTQVVSYLRNMFVDWKSVSIPQDKMKLFMYLSNKKVNYSSLLYMLENSNKITADNQDICYQNLKAYEMFKNFNFRKYAKKGKISYKRSRKVIERTARMQFESLKSDMFRDAMKDFYDSQECIYCLLMKAVLIEIGNSKKSASNKMKSLIEFVNAELGVFMEREMAICYYFFMHDERTDRFFKKTKPNSKNIAETIYGMAWDLTHARLIERWYDFIPVEIVKYGIHPILTYDNGLKDVLSLFPIKKMAIYNGYTIPHFKVRFVDLFPEAIELIFDEAITLKRKEIFQNRDMSKIIEQLQGEIGLVERKER